MTINSPAQIASDPILFAKVFLKILDKDKKLVPFCWNPAQIHFYRHRTGKDLILKSRQLGFSTQIQGEMFRETVTSTQTTITLAHDIDTTQKLRRMTDRFYNHCSFNEIQPIRHYSNATLATYPEWDSTAMIATAGNVETGRGDTYTRMHGSEVAFWRDAARIVAGAMQGGSPQIILESTPNGAQGFFYEKCMEAFSSSKSPWRLHFYPWWWEERYQLPLQYPDEIVPAGDEAELIRLHALTLPQIKWRRAKQQELGRFFIQEYPEDPISCFLTSGNSYFGNTAPFFVAPPNPAYQTGHDYFAGLDFGQTSDYTAMVVLDRTTKQQVDLLHINKLEWAEQRRRIVAMYRKWHCNSVTAEWNSIGGPNVESLRTEGLVVNSFVTTNAKKAGIMAALYEGLHTEGLQLLDEPIVRHELNIFVSTQTPSGMWRLAAEGEGHDDTVMALSLAWRACYTGITQEEIDRYTNSQTGAPDEDQTPTKERSLPDDLQAYLQSSGVAEDASTRRAGRTRPI